MESKSNPRLDPWQIRESEFPRKAPTREALKFLLRYAMLAPSGHNTQPWKFVLHSNGVEVHADLNRSLPVADPDNREMIISVGAAIMHLRIAAARFGFDADVKTEHEGKSEDLLAYVSLSPSDQTDQDLRLLFPSIVRRHTNRSRYEPAPLPESVLSRLNKLTIGRHSGITIITDRRVKQAIAELVAEGDKIQYSDPAFRKELGGWVRPNSSKKGDGIAADAFGISDVASHFSPWIMKKFNLGRSAAKTDYHNTLDAAALVVFHGDDTRDSLLEVGRMLSRFVLTLTNLGVQYAFLNQPIEVRELRGKLQSMLTMPDLPQLMLRVGFGYPQEKAMPRRPLESVVAVE